MADLLIRGARVLDGSGRKAFVGDLAVHDGRFVESAEKSAPQVIDAGGLCLMPGIVDVHTHYDAQAT